MKSDIGNFYDLLNGYYYSQKRELSYLNDSWTDLESWKTEARRRLDELLSYDPPKAALSPKTVRVEDFGEYVREEIEFNTSALTRIKASVLVPKNGEKQHPAVVAIHDHGGFYYYSREKIMENTESSPILDEFKRREYDGYSWADELTKRGYLVLVIEGFYFGGRKLQYEAISDEIKEAFGKPLKDLIKGSDEYISAFNKMCNTHESLLVKHILAAGATWPGILSHDDRASVSYLFSRADVDSSRIACMGLSIGGFRSALLNATDSRIKCAVVAGWMTTMQSLLFDHLRNHTFMVYIPGLVKYMELPDLVSLNAPNYLFVQQCLHDALYTKEGMEEACNIIQKVYSKAGCSNRFKYAFYENPHRLTKTMQEEAFLWLAEHL